MSVRKRKRKKSYFLSVLVLLIVLFAASYTAFPVVRDNVNNFVSLLKFPQPEKDGNGTISEEPTDNLPPDESEKPLEQKITVYDILGESNLLDATKWGNMLAMRYDAKKLAIKNPDTVYINGKLSSKSVCLTFDDGPDGEITSKIIDVLDSYNVKGNFFFVGQNVVKYPEVVKKAFDSGHLIGCHSFSHTDFTKLNAGGIKPEIEKANDEIEKQIGKRPLLVRPPYGASNDDVVSAMSSDDYKIILWSIDTLDWLQKDADNIVKNVMYNVRPGEIILMHSTSDTPETLKALPMLIEKLKEKGYNMTTLDKMLGTEAYK